MPGRNTRMPGWCGVRSLRRMPNRRWAAAGRGLPRWREMIGSAKITSVALCQREVVRRRISDHGGVLVLVERGQAGMVPRRARCGRLPIVLAAGLKSRWLARCPSVGEPLNRVFTAPVIDW